jgi:hypothetical protein
VQCENRSVYNEIRVCTASGELAARTQNLRFANYLCAAQIVCSLAPVCKFSRQDRVRQTDHRLFSDPKRSRSKSFDPALPLARRLLELTQVNEDCRLPERQGHLAGAYGIVATWPHYPAQSSR